MRRVNWFTRILILIVASLIAVMIAYNFFYAAKGYIQYPILILISLLIIVILSEEFSSLSIGNILSLKKNIEEKKEEIRDLKIEKQNLFNLIVSNSNHQQQITNHGLSFNDAIKLIVENTNEVKEEEEELLQKETSINKSPLRRINYVKLEKFVIDRFIADNNFKKFNIFKGVQISSIDPVSSFNPVFRQHIETESSNIFFEIKTYRSSTSALFFRDNLYIKLMNVYNYQQQYSKRSYIQLILVKLPDAAVNAEEEIAERLREYFAPAINQGLLKLLYMEIKENEIKQFEIERSDN